MHGPVTYTGVSKSIRTYQGSRHLVPRSQKKHGGWKRCCRVLESIGVQSQLRRCRSTVAWLCIATLFSLPDTHTLASCSERAKLKPSFPSRFSSCFSDASHHTNYRVEGTLYEGTFACFIANQQGVDIFPVLYRILVVSCPCTPPTLEGCFHATPIYCHASSFEMGDRDWEIMLKMVKEAEIATVF